MTGPGRPLGPVNIRWTKIPGRDIWYNLDTGKTTNRNGFRNIVAQKYGFRNATDFDRFNAQLNGIGGLTGHKVKDVQRVHNIVRKYERDRGLPAYSIGFDRSALLTRRAQEWLLEPPGKYRNELLLRMLDSFGVPRPKYKWAPGDSP